MSDLWHVSFQSVDGPAGLSIPTLCCVGNGRIGVRGAVPELPNRQEQGIFLAGYYDQLPRPELDPKKFNPFLVSWSHLDLVPGYHREVCLVKCPNFLDGRWSAGGVTLDSDHCRVLALRQELDMAHGEFSSTLELSDPAGRRFTLRMRRFAHMEKQTRVYTRYELTSHDYEGEVCYTAGIDDDTKNFNISGIYQDTTDGTDEEYLRLYDPVRMRAGSDGIFLLIRGRVDGHKAAFATCLLAEDVRADGGRRQQARMTVRPGGTVVLDRVSVFEADLFAPDVEAAVQAELEAAKTQNYVQARAESDRVWAGLWADSDIRLEGDDRVQLGLRHSIYQLLIAACRGSDRVSIPAKGLTGEGYRGMVFWDTDIHMAPFYLYTQPEIAAQLVRFRVRTLDGARAKAARYGCRGASFPWETGCSGQEECESFLKLLTHQLHITADVVYTAWRYVRTAGGREALWNGVAELYLETARFWLSKGFEKDGLWNIPAASGPDELHLECDNNAYVNNLAQLNLTLAWQAWQELSREDPARWQRLLDKTGMTEEELALLERFHGKVRTMQGPDGLLEQCEGFFGLEDRIVFEDSPFDVPADTQTVKQADVLMLLFLLPGLVDAEGLRANWDYYEPRTTHTSSLSYGVHGILATRLGLAEKAAYYLDKSLSIDLYDAGGGCQDGAHLAADGMSWSAVVSGMCGCELNGDVLSVSPALPEGWKRVSFTLKWQGRTMKLTFEPGRILLHLQKGRDLPVLLWGEAVTVKEGQSVCRER